MAIKEIQLTESEIVELWGEGFRSLSNHPQIKFSQETVSVELKRSPALVQTSGEESKTIKLEEPTVETLKMMDLAKGDVGKVASLIQGCGGIPAASVNKIKASDFMLLSEVVAAFLGSSQKTTGM